jgi:molybdenum cofactor cytidylyltransferase
LRSLVWSAQGAKPLCSETSKRELRFAESMLDYLWKALTPVSHKIVKPILRNADHVLANQTEKMKKIIAVILAAGSSRRLGFNKLTIKINGESVIRRSVKPFLEQDLSRVLVVTGHAPERIMKELDGMGVETVNNPDYREGMSASVRTAVPFLADADAVFFHLGDKPFVKSKIITKMKEEYETKGAGVVVPLHKGVKGHPVLVDACLLRDSELSLRGDLGLREVIEKYEGSVVFIEGDEGSLFDIDTVNEIAYLRERGYDIEES